MSRQRARRADNSADNDAGSDQVSGNNLADYGADYSRGAAAALPRRRLLRSRRSDRPIPEPRLGPF